MCKLFGADRSNMDRARSTVEIVRVMNGGEKIKISYDTGTERVYQIHSPVPPKNNSVKNEFQLSKDCTHSPRNGA